MTVIKKRKNVVVKRVTTTSLAVMLGGGVLSSLDVNAPLAAENTSPPQQESEVATRPTYDSVFKIQNSNISNFSTNAGDNPNNPLPNVFDGNVNTYWQSNTPNTNDFKNHIIVTFKEEVTLDSMIYKPNVQDSSLKGFPTKFSIYASLADSGEDFFLAHSGTATVSSNELKINFNKEVKFKRLKFVFNESNEDLPSASELIFYKADTFKNKVEDLFTDYTMSQVKEGVTLEQLNQLLEESKTHPNAELTEKIEIAKSILEQITLESKVNNLFTDDTMTQVKADVTLDEINKLLEESKTQSNAELIEKIQKAKTILEKSNLENKVNNLFTDNTLSTVKEGTTLEELNAMLEESKAYSSLLLTEKIQLAIDNLKKSNTAEEASSNKEKSAEENSEVEVKSLNIEASKEISNAPAASAAAEVTAAKPTYDSVFRIPQESIVGYSNNAGSYTNSPLSNMFDGNTNTHWETNKSNTDTFKNHLIISFKEEVTLGSMVYYPRVTGAANKGFPKKYSIYASLTDNAEDFTLVQSGTASVGSGGLKIKFNNETKFKRLKFVFEDSHQDWSAASELAFYKPDPLSNEVDTLFKDLTQTKLKDGVTLDSINKLLEEAKTHPNDHLREKLELAKRILNGTNLEKDIMIIEQRGDGVNHARNVLKTSSYGTNLLPTGIAALAGQTIKVYVDVEEGKPLPSITFSQQVGHWSGWQRNYALQRGENILTVPKIYNEDWTQKVIPGGAIYIVNPYTAEEQGQAPRIRIEGGHDFPLFNDGDDVNAFLEELKEYKTKLTEHPDKYVDVVELVNDYLIMNSNMQSAEKAFLNPNFKQTPQGTLDFNKDRLSKFFDYAGIGEEGEINHIRNGARANLRLMQPWAFAYAAGDHTGFQQGSATTIFQGTLYGWAESHELGHHFDIKGGFIGEVTNNMWANHNAVDFQNENDRIANSYATIFQKHASDDYSTLVVGNEVNSLSVWWQLHLLDEDYWPKYQTAYRNDIAADMDLTKEERMAVVSSYALGMDITEHFERYKFINAESATKVRNTLKTLKIPEAPENIKPWYLWTKATKDRESSFEQKYLPEIASVTQNDGKIQIKIAIDEAAKDALLGYEVIQDGKIIGFTNTDTFTTLADDDGKVHTYEVRAFDLRSEATQYSESVTVKTNSPIISVVDSTVVDANSTDFDINSVVTAHDSNGKVVTNITSTGTVDTTKPGEYKVTYTATDEAGVTSTKDLNIIVSPKTDHISTLAPTASTVELDTIKEDQSVNLTQDGTEITYDNGLVVPTTSKITYNIKDKNYKYFEAFTGVTGNNSGENEVGTAFEVWVDGIQRFRSGEMNSDSNKKYLNIDVEGAEEIVLVTKGSADADTNTPVWADAKFTTNYVEPSKEANTTTDENTAENTTKNNTENTTEANDKIVSSESNNSTTCNNNSATCNTDSVNTTPTVLKSNSNNKIPTLVSNSPKLDASKVENNNSKEDSPTIEGSISKTTPSKVIEDSENNEIIKPELDTESNEEIKNKVNLIPSLTDDSEDIRKTLGISLTVTGITLLSLMKLKRKVN